MVRCHFLLPSVFREECVFIMSERSQFRFVVIRCFVVLAIAVFLVCIGNLLTWQEWIKRIPRITNGAGIPVSGKILGKGPGFGLSIFNMSPDRNSYLVFVCSEPDIREFARRFSEGISIDDWNPSPDGFVRPIRNHSDQCPNFDLTKIKNGRYRHGPGMCCAIDLDRNIVYLLD